MTKLKTRMMVGAYAFAVGAAAFAGSAQAVTNIYGSGSTLIAPYARQSMDCYGNQHELSFTGPVVQTLPYFNFTGTNSFDCDPANPHSALAHGPVNNGVTFFFDGTGSGTGIKGMVGHSGTYAGDTSTDPGTQLYPSIQYGLSDTGLDGTDVGGWNNGIGDYASDGLCNDGSTRADPVGTTPNHTGHLGLCVAAPGESPPGGSNGVVNPKEHYGALVQFPVLVAPVTIAYDPVYKRVRRANGTVASYSFAIDKARADGSGGLRLDAVTYCKIFNGEITDWNDAALKALNGGKSLRDHSDPVSAGAWSVPIVIVGRSDSSGTTSIFTRHLANVCSDVGGNQYATGTTTLPATLRNGNAVYNKTTDTVTGTITPGNYVTAAGNDGVAQYVDFRHDPAEETGSTLVWGRMGYVGPDYVLPFVLSTGTNNYGLNTATLRNGSNKYVDPTPASALAAFSAVTPPDSKSSGHYDPVSSDPRDRANPQDWVEPTAPTSPLANPSDKAAYPIVGSTNALLYSCYSTAARVKAIAGQGKADGFFDWYFSNAVVNNPTLGILAKAGFAAVPSNWRTAITETFLGKDTIGLGLEVSQVGQNQCTNGEVGG